MSDIRALELLAGHLKDISSLSEPPDDISVFDEYKERNKQVIRSTLETAEQVSHYGKEINESLDKIREALKANSKRVQDAIKGLLDKLRDLKKSDFSCVASDCVDDISKVLNDDQKIMSSVVTISNKKHTADCETPMRVYIPHKPIKGNGEEVAIKTCIDGSDWVTSKPIPPTAKTTKKGICFVGAELGNFQTAKVAVVARPETDTVVVHGSVGGRFATKDKDVKFVVSPETFDEPTKVDTIIRQLPTNTLKGFAEMSPLCRPVVSASSLVTLDFPKAPSKSVGVNFLDQPGTKTNSFPLYRTKEKPWAVAESSTDDDNGFTVHLPPDIKRYIVIHIHMHMSAKQDDAMRAAESIYDQTNKSVVRLIVKQKKSNRAMVIVHCVKREDVSTRLVEIKKLNYTEGADSSREFCLRDGQTLQISCSGNIETTFGQGKPICLPFFANLDSAKQEIIVKVKDKQMQKDMAEYRGMIVCEIKDCRDETTGVSDLKLEVPLTLQKVKKSDLYLKSLSNFVAWRLTEVKGDDWKSALNNLEGDMTRLYRNPKIKKADTSKTQCQTALMIWLQGKTMIDDKLVPIQEALKKSDLGDISKQCSEFVENNIMALSDEAIASMATKVSGTPREIGQALGFSTQQIDEILEGNPGRPSDQIESMLSVWRYSDEAVKGGTSALSNLKQKLRLNTM